MQLSTTALAGHRQPSKHQIICFESTARAALTSTDTFSNENEIRLEIQIRARQLDRQCLAGVAPQAASEEEAGPSHSYNASESSSQIKSHRSDSSTSPSLAYLS